MTETRQRLLDGTRACIRSRGLVATTSREITATAGVNLAAITYHFGSKDELVAEALLGSLRASLAPALDVLASEGDPATRTVNAVATLVASFEQQRDEAPVYLEALVHALRLPSLHNGVVALWAQLRDGLIEQMDAMRDEGVLPAWVQSHSMAALLIATANGLVLQVTLDPDGPKLSAMAEQFARVLLSAGNTPGS